MKNRRKFGGYFIYPPLQFALILVNVIIISLSTGIIYFKIIDSFKDLQRIGTEAGLADSHPYFSFLDSTINLVSINIAWTFTLSIFLTIAASIYLSHKIVGPVYRLKHFFINIVETKEKNHVLSFRAGDYYSDLPAIINSALDKIKNEREG